MVPGGVWNGGRYGRREKEWVRGLGSRKREERGE